MSAACPTGSPTSFPASTAAFTRRSDWFLTQGGRPPNGACVLEEPRHVVLFNQRGGTVDVLNRFFACAPRDADRICRALFRAFPSVHRLHLDVMFPPERLAFPHSIVEQVSHMVIELPAIGRRVRPLARPEHTPASASVRQPRAVGRSPTCTRRRSPRVSAAGNSSTNSSPGRSSASTSRTASPTGRRTPGSPSAPPPCCVAAGTAASPTSAASRRRSDSAFASVTPPTRWRARTTRPTTPTTSDS